MVKLIVKNINEVESEYHNDINSAIKEKHNYFDELFKRYDKDLTFEVIFDHSSSVYKVSASINLKSKKVLLAEEDKDALKALHTLLSKFKKAVKHEYEIERKDYEYKRKRPKKQ